MACVSRRILAEYIAARLREGADEQRLAQAIAAYLVAEKRSRELPQLMRDVEKIRAMQDGVLEVNATSARTLSDTQVAQIRSIFGARATKVLVDEQIDTSLIGGLKLETADSALDESVKGKLENLYRSVAA